MILSGKAQLQCKLINLCVALLKTSSEQVYYYTVQPSHKREPQSSPWDWSECLQHHDKGGTYMNNQYHQGPSLSSSYLST